MIFINREKELSTLEKEYRKPEASFVVIYGRRRTGKTTLIEKFIENKKAIYFLADLQNETLQIERFKSIVAEELNDDFLNSIQINQWDSIFRYITQKSIDDKLVIVVDEFQYLAKVNPAIASIFQRIWDQILADKNIMLILCGSFVGLMHQLTLNYTSPLYGRRTAQIKLSPMTFRDFKKFFKEQDNQRLLEFYGVFGGIPRYIKLVREDKDIYTNISENILQRDSFLYQEPKFVLKDEVRDPVSYFSILQVIASGEHKIGSISAKLNLKTQNITSFLEKLLELEIVERQVPATEEHPHKSKKGLYFIKDNFFNFWFRYIFPFQSYLETDKQDFVLEKIKSDFNLYMSSVFEQVSREFITYSDILPFTPLRVGRWWDKNTEIDVIALSDDSVFFGECKYTGSPVPKKILYELIKKSEATGVSKKEVFYGIFSKSGFEKELLDLAQKEKNILLFSLEEM